MKSAPTITAPEDWARFGWIVESVADRHGLTKETILGPVRTSRVSRARHELATSLWASGLAFAEVGRLLGLDHTSVIYAVRKELR